MTCMHYRNKSLHYIFWLWEQVIYIYINTYGLYIYSFLGRVQVFSEEPCFLHSAFLAAGQLQDQLGRKWQACVRVACMCAAACHAQNLQTSIHSGYFLLAMMHWRKRAYCPACMKYCFVLKEGIASSRNSPTCSLYKVKDKPYIYIDIDSPITWMHYTNRHIIFAWLAEPIYSTYIVF